MGISQWSGAQWIRRPTSGNDSAIDYTLARNQFGLDGGRISRALVYIAAPMRWQLRVNGQVVDTQDDYQTVTRLGAVQVRAQRHAAVWRGRLCLNLRAAVR